MASIDAWPIAMMLVMGNIINVMLMKPDWLKKRGKAIISLFSASIMASTIIYLYSHYAFEPLHMMNHTLFKTAYIFTMLILVQENIQVLLGATKRLYNVVELNVFDQLHYSLARIVLKTAKIVQRIQTGNLNTNMLMVLVFFLLFLITLILGSLI